MTGPFKGYIFIGISNTLYQESHIDDFLPRAASLDLTYTLLNIISNESVCITDNKIVCHCDPNLAIRMLPKRNKESQ